ncbi:heterokaryon incompatibility protein-domain-containing protein, partial [Phaeosphaeriaceae sp. PMI808]
MVFQYGELSRQAHEIRLLQILPSSGFEAHIECDIQVVSLTKDKPVFSYVWGNQTHRKPISINGSMIMISESLELALRYVLVLWADALCINQDDLEERTHQVSLMGDIYRQAECVVAWLGE